MTTSQKVGLTAGAIVLAGLALYYLSGPSPRNEEDRPPIIVGNGSVYLDADKQGSRWGKHLFRKHYAQDHQGGKEVERLTATSGACQVQGEAITITYGSTDLVLARHRRLFGKYHTDARLADQASAVASATRLEVETAETLTSFRNENGDTCEVSDGRIEVTQVHSTR